MQVYPQTSNFPRSLNPFGFRVEFQYGVVDAFRFDLSLNPFGFRVEFQ